MDDTLYFKLYYSKADSVQLICVSTDTNDSTKKNATYLTKTGDILHMDAEDFFVQYSTKRPSD